MRLRSGEVDLEPIGSHCSDIETLANKHETNLRQEKQQQFIIAWLQESAGPPASPEWTWDNREGYREELTECIRHEIQGIKMQNESLLVWTFYTSPNTKSCSTST